MMHIKHFEDGDDYRATSDTVPFWSGGTWLSTQRHNPGKWFVHGTKGRFLYTDTLFDALTQLQEWHDAEL